MFDGMKWLEVAHKVREPIALIGDPLVVQRLGILGVCRTCKGGVSGLWLSTGRQTQLCSLDKNQSDWRCVQGGHRGPPLRPRYRVAGQ